MHQVPLTLRERYAYGIGQMAEGLFTSSFSVFLFFYYNQVLGLGAGLAGTALLIGLVFDAISDPLAGAISDRLKTSWGRRHPLMLASAVPLAVSVVALFSPPADLSSFWLFGWLCAFNIAARLALTLFYVPHMALGAELASGYHERNRIVAVRQFFSLFGYVAAMAIGFGYFFADSVQHPNGQLNADAYFPFALGLGVMMTLLVLVSVFGTLSRVPFLSQAPSSRRLDIGGFLRENAEALTQPNFLALFLGILGFYAVNGARYTLLLHMNIHYWQLSSDQNFSLVIVGTLSTALSIPVWAYLTRYVEKKPAFMLGLAWWCGFVILPPCLALVGILSPGDHATTFPALMVMAALAGFGGAATTVLGGSMVADCIDEHELQTGRRQEGIFFGIYAFAGKALIGVGTWIGGIALDLINFPVNATVGQVPADTLTALAIVDGPVLALGGVVSFLFLTRYRISKSHHAQTLKLLAVARKESGAKSHHADGMTC